MNPPGRLIKLYVVFVFTGAARLGEPNVKAVGVFVTRREADQTASQTPGSYVVKFSALKNRLQTSAK